MADFAVLFMGNSYPVPSSVMQQVDSTHWLLDVCATITPNFHALKDVCLFLTTPGSLDPSLALGLYVKAGNSGWQFRGGIHAGHPSETMPLLWPPGDAPPGTVQVGVSVEPLQELQAKEGSRVAEKADFARRVALDLYRFLSSFSSTVSLPSDLIDRWFKRFSDKFQRDPDFLTRVADAL